MITEVVKGHIGRKIRGRFAGARRMTLRQDWHRKRFKKQHGLCAICNKPMWEPSAKANPNYVSTLDHIIPLSKGGSDHWENTQAVHYKCNQEKADQ